MTSVSYFIICYFMLNCLLTMYSLTIGKVKNLLNSEPLWVTVLFTCIMICSSSILFLKSLLSNIKPSSH